MTGRTLFGRELTAEIRRFIRLAAVAASLAAVSSILLLAISGWFLTAAAIAGAAGSVAAYAFNYLIPSATIRLLAILRTVSRYGERLWSHEAALLAMAGLRGRLFARLAAQDSRTAPDFAGGDASARLIGDIDALEDLIVRRPTLPASLVGAIVSVFIAAFAGWHVAAVLLVLIAALPFLLGGLARHLTRVPARDAAEALGALRTSYVDYAEARAEIVAYGLTEQVVQALAVTAADLDRANARLFRGEGAIAAVLALYAGGTAAMVVATATASAPRVALALLASVSAIEAMAAWARTSLRQARVAEGLRRLADLEALPLPPPVAVASRAMALPLAIGSEQIEPGGRVAISGRSGSGKTLLLESLAGWRPVLFALGIADIPIDLAPAAMIREQIALSPQDAPMIAGSIADNLRVARPAVDRDAMWQALHIACLDDRLRAAPGGLDTTLGEGGGLLSGGERKRLSLARAVLAGRPWLLLDEPTEGLDPATERVLVERLDNWLVRTGTGLVLVSHRPGPLALVERTISMAGIRTRKLGNFSRQSELFIHASHCPQRVDCHEQITLRGDAAAVGFNCLALGVEKGELRFGTRLYLEPCTAQRALASGCPGACGNQDRARCADSLVALRCLLFDRVARCLVVVPARLELGLGAALPSARLTAGVQLPVQAETGADTVGLVAGKEFVPHARCPGIGTECRQAIRLGRRDAGTGRLQHCIGAAELRVACHRLCDGNINAGRNGGRIG